MMSMSIFNQFSSSILPTGDPYNTLNDREPMGAERTTVKERLTGIREERHTQLGKDYQQSVTKMKTNINHHNQCVESPERKRPKSPPSKDYKPTFDNEQERFQVLKDENIQLKTKKRELEDKVKMVATKLKRQITQLKKDRILGAGGNLYSRIDEELDVLIDENVRLQDEEARLMTKVKTMQAKRKQLLGTATAQNKKLMSTVKGSQGKSRSPDRRRAEGQEFEITSLRNHLENSSKNIAELKHQVELQKRVAHGGIASEELVKEVRMKELEVAQSRARLEDIQDSFKVKEEIFTQNKTYQDGLLTELKALQTEFMELQTENRVMDESAKDSEHLVQKIQEARAETEKMQKEFDAITRQPFFKRENDAGHLKRLTELDRKVEEKDREIKRVKEHILQLEEGARKMHEEHREVKVDRDTFTDEIERLRLQLDPSSLSLAEIQKKIHDLDPSMFRQVMKDLKYDGEEPVWARFDFLERMRIGPDNQPLDENDPAALRREIERLKLERRDLAAELQKIQNLLKIQVDIDKQNAALYQAEIEQRHNQIQADNRRIAEFNQLINARNQKMIALTKQTNTHGLTAAGLAQIDHEIKRFTDKKDDDAMSEFSIATDESDVLPQENVLDLIVNTANFDKSRLSSLLGNKELLPSAVSTFVTVDFYNHDTRNSDLAQGFEPNYSTQFSFKNAVDDFYIQYLEKSVMVVDFFLSRSQNALKLGSAKLPLSRLLEKDGTFQAQEIVYDGGETEGTFVIGRLFYKMRMRKTLDEALKWFEQRKALKDKKDPAAAYSQDPHSYAAQRRKSKVISITVKKCFDLKRADNSYYSKDMQPFYYYQFFTFEYTSPVVNGSNPSFGVTKQYEIELNQQFMEYMKTQILKIDLIDDSVEVKHGQSDYIGCVRIPLKELLLTDELADNYAVLDEKGHENGRMEVVMKCTDYQGDPYTENSRGGTNGVHISKFIEKEILVKIAQRLATMPYEDIDMIIDLFLTEADQNKIPKKHFKDVVLTQLKVQGVREADLDLLLKQHELLAGKDSIDRQDFKSMFDYLIRDSKQKLIEEQSNFRRQYAQADQFFKSGGNKANDFNMQNNAGHTLNPFSQSINQRDDFNNSIVGGNRQTFGSPTKIHQKEQDLLKQQTLGANKDLPTNPVGNLSKQKTILPLIDQIKDHVYDFINAFDQIVQNGKQFATWEEFKKVMFEFTKNEDDVSGFWAKHNIDSKFYFTDQLMILADQKPAQIHINPATFFHQDPRLASVKQKLQQHLQAHDYSLEDKFNFIDKDRSKGVNIVELTKGFNTILTDEECRVLFLAVDKDESGEISYDELITECAQINCYYVLEKMKTVLAGAKGITVEQLFASCDRDKSGKMGITEFNDAVNQLYQNVTKVEVDSLFRHFDSQGLGQISKDDFKKALTQKIDMQSTVQTSLRDILLPIQTKLGLLQLNPPAVFDKFSKDGQTLTINDFKEIVQFVLKYELSTNEINLLKTAIIAAYGTSSLGATLSKDNFVNLLSQSFKLNAFWASDNNLASQTLSKMRGFLQLQKKTLGDVLKQFTDPQGGLVNIRNMKLFLQHVFNFPQFEIDNLISHLDPDCNGFIKHTEIEKAVEMARLNTKPAQSKNIRP